MDTGEVEIKWGRHPRVTGIDQKLYRVTLDNGKWIDVTENHKFITMDGKEKTTLELEHGQVLPRMKKFIDLRRERLRREYNYVIVHTSIYKNSERTSEHRMIGKFYHPEIIFTEDEFNGCCKTDGIIFHYINENKLDNTPENLQPMTFAEHNRIHNLERENPMHHTEEFEATHFRIG